MNEIVRQYFRTLRLPNPSSHKGQNGKLLIVGGSELFHAASKWSLDIASKFVDMVFYSSIPSNNELVKEAKGEFWNGIVISRQDIEDYIEEADAVLIGPGMTRQDDTKEITEYLLTKYPQKKWVLDAGALQMVNPQLFTGSCIITPHGRELALLEQQTSRQELLDKGVTIVLKGKIDLVMKGGDTIEITGGNPGMTKGGTGDVLAGLISALYATQDQLTATVTACAANKATGDALSTQVGPYYNASDLVEKLPQVFWQMVQEAQTAD